MLWEIHREMCEYPLEPSPYPMGVCKAKKVTWLGRKAARRQRCRSAASDAFVLAEFCSQLAASIGCLVDPWHSPSAPTPKNLPPFPK